MKRRRSDFQYCEYFVRLILSLYFRSDITRAGKKLTDGTGRLIFDILDNIPWERDQRKGRANLMAATLKESSWSPFNM